MAASLLAGCGGDSAVAPPIGTPTIVDLAADWTAATPESQGMDATRVADAIVHAGTVANLRSLLVVRHGRLVVERYFGGFFADSLAHGRSVTKSVVSTLVGIAIARGEIAGVSSTLGAMLPATVATLDAAEMGITVRNLLTMSSGFEWTESGAIGYNRWIVSGDHVQYLLDKPLAFAPGSRFTYNSAGSHLVSVLLTEAVGIGTAEYADLHLFTPLGIPRARWETLSAGYANGGAGLELRPRDMAKIGQLFLQRGASGTGQVVPGAWVEEATTTRFRLSSLGFPVRDLGYGYFWWTENAPPDRAYFAWGYGGQFIYVVPSKDLVVVATSHWQGLGTTVAAQETGILGLIVNHVVPAANP